MLLTHAAERALLHKTTAALGVVVCLWLCALSSGCHHDVAVPELTCDMRGVSGDALVVPANAQWVDSGMDVQSGESVTLVAHGRIRHLIPQTKQEIEQSEAGPAGTFFYDDSLAHQEFPLPAAGSGPAPCYCLIGRIGEGRPFFVGDGMSIAAESTGRLYLGVNDFDVTDNTGEFYVEVSKPDTVQPVSFRQDVRRNAPEGLPAAGCSVVVFYIDGLRPDVLEEMSAMHHVPHLTEHFIDGGTHMRNTFTAFPSDTITSNGTMWTGCFSDRHGIKGQIRFSRQRLESESGLDPMGPSRTSRLLRPHGTDKLIHNAQAATVGYFEGNEAEIRWKSSKRTGIPAVYDYLRVEGNDWATGVLPIMTDAPPSMWTRSLARHLPYFQAHQAWQYIDDANAHFAVRHLLNREQPLTVIWLPETDSISHKYCRGQFGTTRKTIAMADILVGDVTEELRAQGRLQNTYLVLVSDHGHLGGRKTHLTRYDLVHELFFREREVTADGRWVGGGLGLSVRQHRLENWHTGDTKDKMVYVDGNSDGAARIFLPRGNYQSGDWSGPNRPADLLAYQIAPHLPAVDLTQYIVSSRAVNHAGEEQNPVDLALMKLDDRSILITTADRGQAIIDRRQRKKGGWEYRYTVVDNVRPGANGAAEFDVVENPKTDPLKLLQEVWPQYFTYYHDEEKWLQLTAPTEYPDGVVTLTRHMLWQDHLKVREQEYAPDLVVTARHGWFFGTQNTPGTTHGYPLADAVRATWYLSGPNIRRGARIHEPARLADLTPTILTMASVNTRPEWFEGTVRRTVFATAAAEPSADDTPVHWRDVDLQAWDKLDYAPVPEFDRKPITVNRPGSPWDVNNIAYNALTVGDWSVFRLVDDALAPGKDKKKPVTETVDSSERRGRRSRHKWVAEGTHALNVSEVSLGDYSLTSSGNMYRANGVVDWLQNRGTRLDEKISDKVGRNTVLGAPKVNRAVDGVQDGYWDVYKYVQRLMVEVLDETVLNGLENNVDRAINASRKTPPEVLVQ